MYESTLDQQMCELDHLLNGGAALFGFGAASEAVASRDGSVCPKVGQMLRNIIFPMNVAEKAEQHLFF